MSRGARLLWTLLAAIFGFVPGCIFGAINAGASFTSPPGRVESVPLPHHVPKSPNAASFRFAMAHDVIHERYPKHGPIWYQERERLAREKLKTIPPDSDEAFGLYDDIGTGLDRLGKPADAIPILRNKLELQQKRGLNGRELYTTYANLGTFIVHTNMPKAIAGDSQAKAAVREGIDLLKKSVEVNPEAHFGREVWQIVLAEFLLAASDHPKLMTTFDFVGDRIDVSRINVRRTTERQNENEYASASQEIGLAYNQRFSIHGHDTLRYQWQRIGGNTDRLSEIWNDVNWLREQITRIGAEDGWAGIPVPSHRKPVAFDEPLLGIIGMWRQGGGANPHFCLCIGEIMLRVGQRRIAWTAYERCKQLAGKYWPKPEIQQALRNHCDSRQKEIEQTLPADEVPNLRPNFEDELAFGQRYQKEYQDFEAAKIAAGADIHDEHFFDEFQQSHKPIASPTGPEEWYEFQPDKFDFPAATAANIFGVGVLTAGIAAFLTSCWLYRRGSAKKN
jgi:hypothetical protein